MTTLPIGFLLFVAVIVGGMWGNRPSDYINYHSFLLVFGGTIAAFIMSSPWQTVKNLFVKTKEALIPPKALESHSELLIKLAKNPNVTAEHSDHPLIKYATELWEAGIFEDQFIALISQKREALEASWTDCIQSLKNVSKYPPALGMTGTVMGLVSLFSNLDSSNKAMIGPALALALTATFLGLIVSHVLIMPLADHFQTKHLRYKRELMNLYQILLMINQGESNLLIEEEIEKRAGEDQNGSRQYKAAA